MHWVFSLSSWLKCSQSLSESLVALVKIALCSETENKMSWQTKHLHFLDKYLSWLNHGEGLGNDQREETRLSCPMFWVSLGAGEQVGEIHQHLAPAKGSGNFWPAQVYTYAASLYVVKVKMFILPWHLIFCSTAQCYFNRGGLLPLW